MNHLLMSAMDFRVFIVIAGVVLTPIAPARTSEGGQRLKQLIEHWQWEHYWNRTLSLGSMYQAGREFQALLFWRINQIPPSVGFCSTDLGVCEFYPDTASTIASFEMKLSLGEDLQLALKRFRLSSFGQNTLSLTWVPVPKEEEYATEMVMIRLPDLTAPAAIRERRVRPVEETRALVTALGCTADSPTCSKHVLIPFYSPSDPWVPVYVECNQCPHPKPMIIFMEFTEGHWWHGAGSFDDSPDSVKRTRRKIEKALMIEVGR